ncbi:MAG: UDP-N-acetylglucosamine 2-epimerase (hydrolyzing) [Sedimentisphaerales bacterium]|nr:UDP-N-acetylglucosamine 2-epimerase (hydrolyzing) [Sedimentisphaerales bacterium]
MKKTKSKTQPPRRIAVVTGTRAEYGIFQPVLKAIDNHPRLELQLIVTGMHLLKKFGFTVNDIQNDGWKITARVKLQNEIDNVIGQSRGMGRALTSLADTFARLKTDIVLVLGDRIEAFTAAAAATSSQLILAHIHGGDAALGVQDDAYRHAITKLAHLHFAATKDAADRISRLGEQKFRIYQTGSPALDNISELICRDSNLLSNAAQFDVSDGFLLVLQHPAGGSAQLESKRMAATLEACRRKHLKTLVLYPNSDPGFSGIISQAQRFCKKHHFTLLKHVPRNIYLGLLENAAVLIGNSSSGLIEAGFLNVNVVNVGPRQTGRLRGPNVIDVPGYNPAAISNAIEAAQNQSRNKLRGPIKIYGDGHSSKKIAAILARAKLNNRLRQKQIAY